MDPVSVAMAVVAFLSPYLAEGGKAAAKKGGEALVSTLERRFKGKPAAEEALQDVKAAPQDADAQAALRLQLKKALAADAGFMAAVVRLLEQAEAEAAGQQISLTGSGAIAVGDGAVAAGERGVAIGGDVKGPIITGDCG